MGININTLFDLYIINKEENVRITEETEKTEKTEKTEETKQNTR